MIKYAFHVLGLLMVAVFEFGFLHSLSQPWSLIPLGVCIAIYFVFSLRPYVGLSWLFGMGIIREIHSVEIGGDIIIAALFGAILVYIIEQHVTHMSIYAAVLSAAIMMFFWITLSALFGAMAGNLTPMAVWLNEAFMSAFVAAVSMSILMIVFPLARKAIRKNIRIA